MRWREINETSMSEFAAIIEDIRTLPSVEVDFDLRTQRLFFSFVLNGLKGTLRMRIRPEGSPEDTGRKFRSKLYAAAIAVLNGRKPRSWESALNTVRGTIRTQAIKILTNPDAWIIERLRYGDFSI